MTTPAPDYFGPDLDPDLDYSLNDDVRLEKTLIQRRNKALDSVMDMKARHNHNNPADANFWGALARLRDAQSLLETFRTLPIAADWPGVPE